MKTKIALFMLTAALCTSLAAAQDRPPRRDDGNRSPPREGSREPRRGNGQESGRQQYSIEQAVSDQAQLHTIAFSGLAFMTGDFGSSTFIPPGKVADFFGFQYMRDIDAAGKGHNPMFLDRVAGNVMKLLTPQQRTLFEDAAREQEPLVQKIAQKRFPLVAAFHRELDGRLPSGTTGLSRTAVMSYTADLFELDAALAYKRAKVFGALARSLSSQQKATLAKMKFGDFNSWPEIDREEVRSLRPRGASKLVSVGYMTLASEFFSWYAGSVEADTYFCPERHGTYFGGFYLKDLPAMGQRDFDISTSLTGDSGAAFVDMLTAHQRSRLTGVLNRQRSALNEIIEVRRKMSTALRGFLRGQTPSEHDITALGRRYGELDGALSYEYASAFAAIYKTFTVDQKNRLKALRSHHTREDGTAFIYSDRIQMSQVPDSSFLFGVKK
ncbi:MAG TPA: hypothetical protein HPP76_05515 [Desulfuromonadales bacterium]|nr:hypothetical protein [Desulfuromonadales bacterium]